MARATVRDHRWALAVLAVVVWACPACDDSGGAQGADTALDVGFDDGAPAGDVADGNAPDIPLADAETDAEPERDAGEDADDAQDVAGPKPTWRVLFMGNSYTYVNDLPQVLARLGEDEQSPAFFEVGLHATGGANWLWHDTQPEADALIAEGWDYVVLQDQSSQPWASVGTKPALLSLDAKARAAGAETVLYMTWAREQAAVPTYIGFKMFLAVNNYYERHGAAVGAQVAPIGRAWERGIRTTGIKLHSADGSHPNPRGTYLAAAVVYATLTGESPLGLGDGGLGVSAADVASLQAVAWATIQERKRLPPPAVGAWPLAADAETQDLVPGPLLELGDTPGPDGNPGGATTFGLADTGPKVASIPYIPGMNAARFTLALQAHRADWSDPTAGAQSLVAKSFGYRLAQAGTTLTADLYTVTSEAPVTLTFDASGLDAGWQRLAMTYDGATFGLWVDAVQVASAPATGDVRYYETSADQDHRFNGIAVGARFTDAFEGVDHQAPESTFTGALAGIRLFDEALTQPELDGL